MADHTLKLDAIEFRESPTKSQLINALDSIHKFTSECIGSLMVSKEYGAEDVNIHVLINAVSALVAAKNHWNGQSNLSIPQPQQPRPQMVR